MDKEDLYKESQTTNIYHISSRTDDEEPHVLSKDNREFCYCVPKGEKFVKNEIRSKGTNKRNGGG